MGQPVSGNRNRMANNSGNFSADSRSRSIQVETMEQNNQDGSKQSGCKQWVSMEATGNKSGIKAFLAATIRMEAMGKIGAGNRRQQSGGRLR
jgi:hypothetical protein